MERMERMDGWMDEWKDWCFFLLLPLRLGVREREGKGKTGVDGGKAVCNRDAGSEKRRNKRGREREGGCAHGKEARG